MMCVNQPPTDNYDKNPEIVLNFEETNLQETSHFCSSSSLSTTSSSSSESSELSSSSSNSFSIQNKSKKSHSDTEIQLDSGQQTSRNVLTLQLQHQDHQTQNSEKISENLPSLLVTTAAVAAAASSSSSTDHDAIQIVADGCDENLTRNKKNTNEVEALLLPLPLTSATNKDFFKIEHSTINYKLRPSPSSVESDNLTKNCGLCGFIQSTCKKRNEGSTAASSVSNCFGVVVNHNTKHNNNNNNININQSRKKEDFPLKPTNLIYNNKLNYFCDNESSLAKRNNRSMDRSVDSIGSCSLDVDADSTDFSDTSGSFNLLTPSSGKDFPKEFITRIHERSQIPPQVPRQQTTIVLDPSSGKINTILSSATPIIENSPPSTISVTSAVEAKKPSYLNLACCVNGYSHLTTYDSKLRQNINKSREVSPIRPITYAALQQYRSDLNNQLTVPIPYPSQVTAIVSPETNGRMMDNHRSVMSPEKRLFTAHMMQNTSTSTTTTTSSHDVVDNATSKLLKTTKYIHTSSTVTATPPKGSDDILMGKPNKSFIEQRVERLYGAGALAQGFHANRRALEKNSSVLTEKTMNSRNIFSPRSGEALTSPTKIIKQNIHHHIINHHYNNSSTSPPSQNGKTTEPIVDLEMGENLKELEEALPVLRHLRPEFRAQLPILSPKRTTITTTPPSNNIKLSPVIVNGGKSSSQQIVVTNGEAVIPASISSTTPVTPNNNSYHDRIITTELSVPVKIEDNKMKNDHLVGDVATINVCPDTVMDHIKLVPTQSVPISVMSSTKSIDDGKNEKNGHYFLEILKTERERIIALAIETEGYMEMLSNKNISDEIMGYLRAASGKARLLARQKMNQFEGLCHKNLVQPPEEKFATTSEDLQGFWDMVMLQVNHIDTLFEEIQTLKANNWEKLPTEATPPPPQGARLIKRPMTKSSTVSLTQPKKSATSTIAAQKREAQRKQLMELKRKNKMAINNSEDSSISSSLGQQNGQSEQNDQNGKNDQNGTDFIISETS